MLKSLSKITEAQIIFSIQIDVYENVTGVYPYKTNSLEYSRGKIEFNTEALRLMSLDLGSIRILPEY